ncbi:MAG: Methyltransferase type 11 [Pedosphaera sp.]|nr:Methyltransferase type 11 [Pedosphaera sp.]
MNTTNQLDVPRGKYQGMLQIFAFNQRLYVAGAVLLVLAGIALNWLAIEPVWKIALAACLALTAFWMIFSLVVSHWVYDCSKIYHWTWLAETLPQPPRHWANIHAGLDESSPALHRLFPGTAGTILDIFDSREMTEPSIAAARSQTTNPLSATSADFRSLPLAVSGMDAVFLIFAAHEIRRADSRRQFFMELSRALKPSGCVVLVEHLRDWPNFLAFGPGFLHFHSRRTWLQTARQAGFAIRQEFSITPFVRIFVLQKPL